jgi:anti-sigma B factor antagonist
MSSQGDVRFADGVAIIDLSGRITVGETAGLIRDRIRDLVERGYKNILVNLDGVSYMDSAAGLGELVGCYVTLRNRGGELKLLNPRKTIRELLRITKLETIFEIFSDEQEALGSFRPARSSAGAA